MKRASYRQTFLFGRSSQANAPETLLHGEYDLALLAPSWDHRCRCITTANQLRINTSIVLRFKTKDDLGYQDSHSAAILSYLKQQSKIVEEISGDAIDLKEMWEKVWTSATRVIRDRGAALKVLIDLSTCPRYYSLGLIAALFGHATASLVTVFYAEAEYAEDSKPQPLKYPFSIGQWKAVGIPNLLGSPDPLKKKFYVVSVGFEGAKTARVLAREDPDRVSILFPDPGTRPDYPAKTLEFNREIIDHYKIPQNQIVRAPAGDAIAAWKSLGLARLERSSSESAYYVCSGTKPHALALALRAICLDNPTVLYNLPEGHSFIDVHPSGIFWKYDVRDLSVSSQSHAPVEAR